MKNYGVHVPQRGVEQQKRNNVFIFFPKFETAFMIVCPSLDGQRTCSRTKIDNITVSCHKRRKPSERRRCEVLRFSFAIREVVLKKRLHEVFVHFRIQGDESVKNLMVVIAYRAPNGQFEFFHVVYIEDLK